MVHGGRSSVGRAPVCDTGCRGFKPRRSPIKRHGGSSSVAFSVCGGGILRLRQWSPSFCIPTFRTYSIMATGHMAVTGCARQFQNVMCPCCRCVTDSSKTAFALDSHSISHQCYVSSCPILILRLSLRSIAKNTQRWLV